MTQDKSDAHPVTTANVKTFNADDCKARSHIVINFGEEPSTLVTSLPKATKKDIWKMVTDLYQK